MAWETMCGKNSSHTLAYSIVGLQEANLAYHYPIIYWNCANLISDSGGETGTVNYGKIAAAVSNFQLKGINVSLPDINRAEFSFSPDVERNEIVFGLKPIQGIGASVSKAIISNRPYTSMQNFLDKMSEYKTQAKENKFGDTAMIMLIKAGCFDELEGKNRVDIMKDFIKSISNPVQKLTFSNIEDLNEIGVLTPDQKKFELRLYRFKEYLFSKKFFAYQEGKSASTAFYRLDRKYAEPYFYENFENDLIEGKDYKYDDEGYIVVKRGSIERVIAKLTKSFKESVLNNNKYIEALNNYRFEKKWEEKVPGSVPKWEMDSLCYYYTDHELKGVNKNIYNITNFFELAEDPEISYTYYYRDQEKARYTLFKIMGTVIQKNKDHHTVSLLTLDGVVEVKFYKGQFSFYDKQIVELREDGSKEVKEKSWFQRGNKLVVTGFRRGENFIPRKYKDSIYNHSLQLIKEVNSDGTLVLQSERWGTNVDE